MILSILFVPVLLRAQLPDFTLNVTPTAETCPGNGALAFSVSGIAPGATVEFNVYREPEHTLVSSSAAPTLEGRVAGTYSVVAVQTLNGQSSTRTVEVDIPESLPLPVQFSITEEVHNCSGGGNELIVTITQGEAVRYEIANGPVRVPPQESNVFIGLVPGSYEIAVYDRCGQREVKTHTALFSIEQPELSEAIFQGGVAGNCSSVTLSNTITYDSNTVISYPITVRYKVHPSDGSPDIVDTRVINEGDPFFVEFGITFNTVSGVTYTYDLYLSNSCGREFTITNQVFNPVPKVSLSDVETPCGKFYFTLTASGHTAPYTVNFTDAPEGFIPSEYNSLYPGTYDAATITFGSANNHVPEGTYKVTITDACGRTSEEFELEIVNIKPAPDAIGRNNGCGSAMGWITVSIPDRRIVAATIIEAPSAYTEPLEDNVTDMINNNGELIVRSLPLGLYKIKLADNCGDEYTVEVNVPDYVPTGFSATTVPDCTIGIGTANVSSGNSRLVSASVISAPASFGETLPYDVTAFIDGDSGRLYLDGLPEGDYIFRGTNNCSTTENVPLTVIGYSGETGVPFEFSPHCNSFDIEMKDAGQTGITPTYWLQKENPDVPGQWMHPETGVVYQEGSMPAGSNSVSLRNGTTNYNFSYYGRFRVIKAFETVGSGVRRKNCVIPLGDPFEYYYDVIINNVYKLDCAQYPDDVYVHATGLAPLRYSIVNDLTDEVLVDNGTSNIFSGLAPGVYTFKVENSCGASRKRTMDISVLPDLVTAFTPDDLHYCVQPDEPLTAETDLTEQNAAILNGASEDVYTVTYYLNANDADLQTNAVEDPEHFVTTQNPQTVFARVDHIYINACHDVTSFRIGVGTSPVIRVDEEQYLCETEGALTLSAGPGFDSYLWTPGNQVTPSITVTEPGTYTVHVTVNTPVSSCSDEASITVLPIPVPEIRDVEIIDWTENNNEIIVIMNGDAALYEYSLDNVSFQQSNTFTGLVSGLYTVYVRDRQACTTINKEVALLYYPKFFTPNGDGHNESWRIEYSWIEPGMVVFIYDRFGKLIFNFTSGSTGWDGTFNGYPLPSTDYWFVVNRQDGRIHKGHFSLIR